MLKDQIKTLRLENNMTQEDLAKKLFVSRQTKWENGTRYPDLITVKAVADIFHVSINHL